MYAENIISRQQSTGILEIQGWLNSQPLTMERLRGKVVLLDFWTFDCVNCIRTLPHIRQLHSTYAGDSFVLIGVHSPEFEFERDPENVASAVKRFRIEYPVAIDGENVTWKLYGNQYWPRQTLIDSRGNVRWEHAGEGDYDKMEDEVRALLKELELPQGMGHIGYPRLLPRPVIRGSLTRMRLSCWPGHLSALFPL